MSKHLWDYEHPYYMSEGCYYQSECLEHFDSFDEFLESWSDDDVDLNRIHRWDFDSVDEEVKNVHQITFYYVMQRKGYTYSVSVDIKPEDELAIKNFLKPHAELNKKLWQGVLDEQ